MYGNNFSFEEMYQVLMDPSMPFASDYAPNSPSPIPNPNPNPYQSPISSTDYNQTSSLLGVNTMATTIGNHGHISDQLQPDNPIWVPSAVPLTTFHNPLNQGLGFNEMTMKCVPLEKSSPGNQLNVIKGQWTAEEDELVLFPFLSIINSNASFSYSYSSFNP